MRERPLPMSLPVDVSAVETLALLPRFRVEFYESLYARADVFSSSQTRCCAWTGR